MEEVKEEVDVEKEYLEKNKIKKILIDGEKIYLKKDKLGWHQVNLIPKDLNIKIIEKRPFKINWNNINWKNLISGGSWVKLGIILFIVLIILGCIMEYSIALKTANDCLNNSCVYCQNKLSEVANISFAIK